jgi:hypothetical protein
MSNVLELFEPSRYSTFEASAEVDGPGDIVVMRTTPPVPDECSSTNGPASWREALFGLGDKA